jgi:hypothetical protein
MSAFFLAEEIHWVEFRLARLDQTTGDMVGEHLFFLPRMELVMGNLRRIRREMWDIISQTVPGSMASSFRLSLCPRMEPLPYSNHSIIFPLTTALPRCHRWIHLSLYIISWQIIADSSAVCVNVSMMLPRATSPGIAYCHASAVFAQHSEMILTPRKQNNSYRNYLFPQDISRSSSFFTLTAQRPLTSDRSLAPVDIQQTGNTAP